MNLLLDFDVYRYPLGKLFIPADSDLPATWALEVLVCWDGG